MKNDEIKELSFFSYYGKPLIAITLILSAVSIFLSVVSYVKWAPTLTIILIISAVVLFSTMLFLTIKSYRAAKRERRAYQTAIEGGDMSAISVFAVAYGAPDMFMDAGGADSNAGGFGGYGGSSGGGGGDGGGDGGGGD